MAVSKYSRVGSWPTVSLIAIVTAQLKGLSRYCNVCYYLLGLLFHASASLSAEGKVKCGAGKLSPTLCLGRRWLRPSGSCRSGEVAGTGALRKTASSQYLLLSG